MSKMGRAPGSSDSSSPFLTVAQGTASYSTVVNHGGVAATARPAVAAPVMWVGSVAPTNATANDVWWDTTVELTKRWSGSAWKPHGAATYATLRQSAGKVSHARGVWCQTWDDGRLIDNTVAGYLAQYGGRATFNINCNLLGTSNHISAADVQALVAAGHEIGQHGNDHVDVTTLTPAQRAALYDVTNLETLAGVGKVDSFAYPNGARTSAIDKENYVRFKRMQLVSNLDQSGPSWLYRQGFGGSPPFVIGRFPQLELAQNDAMLTELIKLAGRQPVIIVTYAHELDQPGTSLGPNTSQYLAHLALAQSLGVAMVPLNEVFPGRGMVRDPGFEDAALNQWNLHTSDGSQTATSVADTPDVGLPGTRSLQLVTNATGGSFAYVTQSIPVEPNTVYDYSCRYRTNVASGAILRVREYDYFNNVQGAGSSQTGSSAAWGTIAGAITTAAATRIVHLDCLVTTQSTTSFFDHVDFGPAVEGLYG